MEKASDPNRCSRKSDRLVQLFKRLNQGTDPSRLRKQATTLLSSLSAQEITDAEQSLIGQGFSPQLVQQLTSAFMLIGTDGPSCFDLRGRLAEGHILRRILAEHELVRCFLADMQELVEQVMEMKAMSDTSEEYRRLCHVAVHLESMVEHIDREEDVIFPALHKYGWTGMSRRAKSDHVYLRVAIEDLVELMEDYEPEYFPDFKVRLQSLNKYLVPTFREHIQHEETLLLPIALETIKDEKVWDHIKKVCNEIGYCGAHPS